MAVRLLAIFILGAILGSLVNLAVYRLAWQRRAIGPWLRPADNAPRRRLTDRLPVLGWLGLRREAFIHGRGYWIRPMLLELGVGAILAFLYWWEVGNRGLLPSDLRLYPLALMPTIDGSHPLASLHYQFLAHAVLVLLLSVATWIDIDERTIPDAITVPGTLLGLILLGVWPCSLLPEMIPLPDIPGVVHFPRYLLTCVWLSTPNECEPWNTAFWTGGASLALGMVCFWAWCLALLPRVWRTRHGLRRAWQMFLARLLRDRTSYAILGVGLVGSLPIVLVWRASGLRWSALLSGLVGMAVGGGMVWMVRILGSAMLHREAMGFGDVTLMAMIGAILGWQAAVVVFFLAPFAGLVVGAIQWLLHGKSEIPYGPFLSLAALATVAAWYPIWDQVQNVFTLGWLFPVLLFVCLAMIVVLLPIVRFAMSLVRP